MDTRRTGFPGKFPPGSATPATNTPVNFRLQTNMVDLSGTLSSGTLARQTGDQRVPDGKGAAVPSTQIHSLRAPDHGFGLLGRVAHAVIAEYLAEPLPAPAFHVAYNTLPDPPFPLATQLWHGMDTESGWQACEEDLHFFLQAAAASLRAQPPGDASAHSQETRTMNYLLRLDAMALVWKARYFSPADSVATWVLTADLLAGKAGPADIAPDVAEESLMAWIVDRAGGSLIAWAPLDGTAEDIVVLAPGVDEDDADAEEDPFAAELREVLHAHYAWTHATFGAEPPEHLAPIAAGLRTLNFGHTRDG